MLKFRLLTIAAIVGYACLTAIIISLANIAIVTQEGDRPDLLTTGIGLLVLGGFATCLLSLGGIFPLIASFLAIETDQNGQWRFKDNWLGQTLRSLYMLKAGRVGFCYLYLTISVTSIGTLIVLAALVVIILNYKAMSVASLFEGFSYQTLANITVTLVVWTSAYWIIKRAHKFIHSRLEQSRIKDTYERMVCPIISTK